MVMRMPMVKDRDLMLLSAKGLRLSMEQLLTTL